uniref:Magnesium transporter protein 1 n=1 Tax=Fibrocapsa japonica TaxID=94617 RepID=A0A7S2UY50_9STRA|mmetsp:Transcript_19777/g.28603  ORF Transcript_19777/g.28603 Transcript_19777/m.28603 type:complete len:341 (+) Transcript_19777:109-1131(+)
MFKKTRINVILCMVIILTVIFTPCSPKSPVTGDTKRAQLATMSRKSLDNTVSLDDTSFDFYVANKPRPYGTIVFFTARATKYKCSVCREMEAEYSVLASSYRAHVANAGARNPPTFFTVVDVDGARATFQNYAFQQVPQLLYIPPYSGQESKYVVDKKRAFGFTSKPTAEDLATWLHTQTGDRVHIVRSTTRAVLTLVLLAVGAACLARPIIHRLPTIINLLRNKMLWLLVSLGMYTCSISGMIYDIIRNPAPFFMNHQTGQIVFFHPQANSQFVVEGFIIGGLNLGCALSVIVLATYVPKIKHTQNRSTAIGICTMAFVCLFYTVMSLYRSKNKWYMRI